MPNLIFWLYVGVSVANLLAKVIPSEDLNQFTKPLLMPLLILYVYKSSLGKTTARILWLCLALFFSWIGDVVLMYQGDTFFLIGLIFFLIAQITYTITLRKSSYQKLTINLVEALPFIAYGAAFLFFLLPAGDFTIPIVIYGLVILTMAIMARSREGNTANDSYVLALIGSIFFVLSDSVLAINAFKFQLPYAGIWIMSTYCIAQALLVKGILKHIE